MHRTQIARQQLPLSAAAPVMREQDRLLILRWSRDLQAQLPKRHDAQHLLRRLEARHSTPPFPVSVSAPSPLNPYPPRRPMVLVLVALARRLINRLGTWFLGP